MRSFLHLIALVWGAALVFQGLAEGLPTPSSGATWAPVVAFGFGVVLAIGALRYFWLRSNERPDPGLIHRSTLVILAVAVAASAAAVRWKPPARSAVGADCAAVLEHVETLAMEQDAGPDRRARWAQARPLLENRCLRARARERRCLRAATTFEEATRCR